MATEDDHRLTVTYRCPRCDVPNRQSSVQPQAAVSCNACDWQRTVPTEDLDGAQPAGCLVCGNRDLWRQKEFPPALGLAFVAAGAILSSIAWYYHRPITALGILLAFALLDLLLFAVMPDVLVCYRCGARHRHFAGEYPTFNHETAERYRQERLRLAEAEGSGS